MVLVLTFDIISMSLLLILKGVCSVGLLIDFKDYTEGGRTSWRQNMIKVSNKDIKKVKKLFKVKIKDNKVKIS